MTRNDTLAAYLSARPHEWIDGRRLAPVAGYYAWRSRVSDLRKRGMRIDNRQTPYWDGVATYIVSEYRFVPKEIVREEETSVRLGDCRTASQGEGLSDG